MICPTCNSWSRPRTSNFSEIFILTKFEESHKHCFSRILDPFPDIIMIKVTSLPILEMNVQLKDRTKTLMSREKEYAPNRF